MASKRVERSNAAHLRLMRSWHRKTNSAEARAFGNYHADCIEEQEKLNRVLSKNERKTLFVSHWDYEVHGNKHASRPEFDNKARNKNNRSYKKVSKKKR